METPFAPNCLCDNDVVRNEDEAQSPSADADLADEELGSDGADSKVSTGDLSALPPPAASSGGSTGSTEDTEQGTPGLGRRFLIGAVVVAALIVGVGAWFLLAGRSSSAREAFVIAEVSDGELRALRLGWTPDSAVAAPQRHRTDAINEIRWFNESSMVVSTHVVIGSRVAFIAESSTRRQLVVADPDSRDSEVWFEVDDGSMSVEYSSSLGAFGVTVTLDGRSTCYLVRDSEATRAGRGSCWFSTTDEFLVVDRSDESTSVTRLRPDLSEVSTLSIDQEFEFTGVSTDGRMIHGVDEDVDPVVLSASGEVVWQRPVDSLAATAIWRSDDLRTLVIVVDPGSEVGQVDVISSMSGDPQVRSIEVGERVEVAVSNDGRRMALRSSTYDRKAVGSWAFVNLTNSDVDPTDSDVDLTNSDLIAVDVFDGDLTGIFLSLGGDRLIGWDDDGELLLAGSIADGLRDVFDLEDGAGFALFDAGVIGLSGDEMLLVDPDSGEVSVLTFGVEEIAVPTQSSQEVIVFQNDHDEVVLATVADGSLIELHVAESIGDAQVVDGVVWFTAVRSGSSSSSLYSIPLDGSSVAEQVASDSRLLAAPVPVDFSARAAGRDVVTVNIDLERRECLADGLPVINVGGAVTLSSVPAAGSELCVHLPRTRAGEPARVDITATGGEDLWLELSLDGRVVASGDDVLDAGGAIIGIQPWIVNESLGEGTYRVRVGEYEQSSVSTPVEVSVVPTGTSDPGGTPSAYLATSVGTGCAEALSVGDRVLVDTDLYGGATVCALPILSGPTFLSFYNDGSSSGARAEVVVTCDNGESVVWDSFGFRTVEVAAGKAPVRCDVGAYVSSGALEDVEVWFDRDRAAAESREVVAPQIADGCQNYIPDESLPMGACASGISVLFAQEELEARGYALDADGFHGPESTAALMAFQEDAGLRPTGEINAGTWDALGLAGISADGSGRGDCAIGVSVGTFTEWYLTSVYSSYFDGHVAVACIQPPTGTWQVSFDSSNDTRITLLDYDFEEVDFNDDYYGLDPAVFFPFDGRPYIVIIDRYSSTASFGGMIFIN